MHTAVSKRKMQTQRNHILFDCILFRQLAHLNPIKSLSPKGYGTIGENYAAISSHQTAVQYFEIHVIFYTQLISDVNIIYSYVFTNLKAL